VKPPLHRLRAVDLERLIATGDASVEVVTRSFIDAIHEREPQIEAFAWFDADHALAQARELDTQLAHGSRRGPMHGLPVAVKDNLDTAALPTAHGSSIYIGHVPQVDAACVALLREAGGFVLGKTAMAELANATPGPTRNPHRASHTPGGSSSGSAAAVAAHFAPLALGTQTAGSVIRPAAFCGVFGYKPSRHLVPRAGMKPNSDSLDEVGGFAGCVDDLALLISVLAIKPAWRDLPAQGRAGAAPVLGRVRTPHDGLLSPAQGAALDDLLRGAERHGARHADLAWPRAFDGLFEAQLAVQAYETARALAPEYHYRREHLSVRLVELIEQGHAVAAHAYSAALQLGRMGAAALDSLFGAATVLIAPSSPGEAPAGLAGTGNPWFSRPWQLLGCPMLNLPCGQGAHGLPLGATLLARPGDDARLLAVAAWIEAAA
jgi:amidase